MVSPPKRKIAISLPSMGEEEWQALREPIMSGWVTQGPNVAEFERRFAERHGVKYAIAVTSCTTGLHLALVAMGIGPGDEVIVPAFTWVATANVVLYCGATPVFVDVDRETFNMDPGQVASKVTARTKAVIPVHLFGLCADIDTIQAAVPAHVKILEDAACAVGAKTASGPVGAGPGVAVCFSFHPRKVITTGEGGMITTADRELAERLRALRQHGQGEDGTREPGYNFRMSELAAALGRVQLGRLDEFLDRRRALAQAYQQGLHGLGWLQLPPLSSRHIFQSYVVRLREDAPVSRETMLSRLSAEGIACQAGVQPIHHHRPYRDAGCVPLPVSEQAGRSAVFLPMFALMTGEQVERVCAAIIALGA